MFCSKCGAELGSTDRFCPNCGTKVEVTADSKSTDTSYSSTMYDNGNDDFYASNNTTKKSYYDSESGNFYDSRSSRSGYTSSSSNNDGTAIGIVAIVLALLAPFIGFIVSLIGLSKTKDGSGRGLCVAALVISIISFIIVLIIFIAAFYYAFKTGNDFSYGF